METDLNMLTSLAVRPDVTLCNVVDVAQDRAAHQPNHIAYTFLKDGEEEASSLTYHQLDLRARACAAHFKELGLTGERALLLLPSGPEFVEAFLGCLYAGVTAVPAYLPRNRRSLPRIEAIATDADAIAVLTTAASAAKIRSLLDEAPGTSGLRYAATDAILTERAQDWTKPRINPDTLAFLQYTSGSTGSPKGVMVTHGNILSNEEMIHDAFQLRDNDVGLGWLPLFHDMGLIGQVLAPIYAGIPSILMSPAAFLQKPIRWLRAIAKYRATISGGPNFAYELCLRKIPPEERETLDLSSWRVAFNGAEPIRATILDEFARAFAPCGFRREAFLPCYGMAEATLMVSAGPAHEAPVVLPVDGEALEKRQRVMRTLASDANARSLVGCGTPNPGALLGQQVLIVNPKTATRCQPHEIGEIWVAGPHVAKGYWNRSEVSRETFDAHLADTGQGPFLRTGDLGFLRNGELLVTGRLNDLIVLNGRNLYPQDIEWTIEHSHPALALGGAAAFSVDTGAAEQLVVVQALAYRQKPDLDAVLGCIRQAIAETHEASVHEIVLIKPGSLPKTSSGKVQRQGTRTQYLTGALQVVASWRAKAEDTAAPAPVAASPVSDEPQGKTEPSASPTGRPPAAAIIAWLTTELAQKLDMSPAEIDIHQPFTYYGVASVEGVTLAAKLEEHLGRTMPLSLIWDYPSIRAVAEYLNAA